MNVPVRIPHLKFTSTYSVAPRSYNPFPFTTATGNEPSETYIDDQFSHLLTLPFPVCFYDSTFTQFVIGSNGVVTFDISNADCKNDWNLQTHPIPYIGTGTCSSAGDVQYPAYSIMGVYHDIDPSRTATGKKIEWRVEGSAPCRKLVISFNNIPLFGDNDSLHTSQIVVYESTGVIDVFIKDKPIDPGSWNLNLAILGVQKNATTAVAAPGKNCTAWDEHNTAYSFIPSGGASRFVSCSVQQLDGTFIANGDTATTTPGLLDVTFPTFCPVGTGGQYVVKTIFSACDNPTNQIVSYDTITINKTNSLTAATQNITPTSCGASGSGSVTAVVPNGIGTGPFTFTLNPGGITLSGSSPQQFNGLNAGNYSIIVHDASNCRDSLSFAIVSTGVLAVDYNITNTSCIGGTNGQIIVTPPNGTPPITYSINGGPFTSNNVFPNLVAGTYFISTHDAAGCKADFIPVTIASGPTIMMTTATTLTSCPGAANGSISVTSVTGTAPYLYSINGGPYQTDSTFGGLIAGTYFISLSDAIGCTISTIPVTVSDGTSTVTGSAAPTSTTCAGVNNGKITVTPNGTGPFQFSINNGVSWQSSNTFTGLAPGTYNVIIREGGACMSAPIQVTITAGAGLQGSATQSPATCNGAHDGKVTVLMTSGAPPYTFVLDGITTLTSATNTVTFLNVTVGAHNVTVTDGSGCVTTSPITVSVAAGTGFTAAFNPIATGCAGANNGSLVINAQTPGTAPFTVVLNPVGTTQTTNTMQTTFGGLAAGSYAALITDANGCQVNLANMTVPAGAGLVGSPTPTGTSCTGVNNGTVTINMTSGGPPFTAVMDGSITQTSSTTAITFTGVAAGSHSVTVTDANGCITTSPITTSVAAGTGFTAAFTPTATGCAGASNGKLVINAQTPQGTAPFTVILNPGAITQVSATSTITFNNLSAGTYSALIADANGCQFTLNNMTVASGNSLNALPAVVGTSCNGALNGSVTVTPATNGTAPYAYSINGGTPQASPTFGGLAAGSYTINVSDAGGCSSGNLSVVIAAGPSINVRPDKIDANCYNSLTGSIAAVPSPNATAPIQYSLDNITWQASPNFANLAAGTYNVYIKDAVGCTNSADTVIGQPTQLLATTSQQMVLCNSASNGKIVVAATGGTLPYYYSLNGGTYQTNNTFNVPAGNNYTIDVKDANGCAITSITNITVAEPAVLTAVQATSNATCDGGNNGTISITPAGGTAPYQYAITGGTFQPGNVLNVGPGTYDLIVKDVNGCSYAVNGVVVGLTNNLTYTHMTDPPAICESKTTQLQLVTNATQFSWSNATSLSNSTVSNPMATPPLPTLYYVTATLGRCSIKDSVFVDVMAAPFADAGPPGDICYGKSYQLQGSGGVSYSWTPSTYLSSYSDYNPVVTPEKTITYYLTVTDANGCASLSPAQVTVKVTPPIKVNIYPADTIVYAGAQVPYLATSAGTDYIWSNTTGSLRLNNPSIPNPVATAPLADGSVVVYKVVATTSAGCQGEAYARIQVYKGPDLYMVTGFTPNGDGKNDVFVPIPVGIKQLNYFRVVDRWGQTLFMTKDLNIGWDGRYRGVEQASGVYVWMVQGVTMDNKLITKKGTVTLIR